MVFHRWDLFLDLKPSSWLKSQWNPIWLLVWNMNFIFSPRVGMMIQSDELIFFRGVKLNHQPVIINHPFFIGWYLRNHLKPHLVGGFKHGWIIFHNIWGSPSHWLYFFSRWLKPPTSHGPFHMSSETHWRTPSLFKMGRSPPTSYSK